MSHYRVYLLDDLGRIFHGEDVQAPDDSAAIAAAGNLLETHNANDPDIAYGIEVWLGKARILNNWTGSGGGIGRGNPRWLGHTTGFQRIDNAKPQWRVYWQSC